MLRRVSQDFLPLARVKSTQATRESWERTGADSAIDLASVVGSVVPVTPDPTTASFALPNRAAASSVTLEAASEMADVTCSVAVTGFVSSALILLCVCEI